MTPPKINVLDKDVSFVQSNQYFRKDMPHFLPLFVHQLQMIMSLYINPSIDINMMFLLVQYLKWFIPNKCI